ncbi:MAG: cytochrome c-type biogenesis protein CcmH [Acidobacteriota bacterium]|nr:cytochrome c-type biogenesis protein CcmH [Acidobacteriota bacterium]MDP2390463.1 cytochrome c-type biogenesis protein CcmH [Acidobacteriota bacterium]
MARLMTSLVVFLLLATASPVHAQANVDQAADRLFNTVMSPYCPGKLLATCGSGQADTLRQEIRQDLAAGKPADEIEAGLYYRFGDSIRSEPQASGVGLVAWVFPAVLLLGTGAWLVLWLRRARPAAEDPSPAVAVSPQMRDRLDDELLELN